MAYGGCWLCPVNHGPLHVHIRTTGGNNTRLSINSANGLIARNLAFVVCATQAVDDCYPNTQRRWLGLLLHLSCLIANICIHRSMSFGYNKIKGALLFGAINLL